MVQQQQHLLRQLLDIALSGCDVGASIVRRGGGEVVTSLNKKLMSSEIEAGTETEGPLLLVV